MFSRVTANLLETVEYTFCQMGRQLVVTVSYTRCIKTCCTTGFQFQDEHSCTVELEKAGSRYMANEQEKLPPSSLGTSSRVATINERRNIFNRRPTTPSGDLLIERRSVFRVKVWNCSRVCRIVKSGPARNSLFNSRLACL